MAEKFTMTKADHDYMDSIEKSYNRPLHKVAKKVVGQVSGAKSKAVKNKKNVGAVGVGRSHYSGKHYKH